MEVVYTGARLGLFDIFTAMSKDKAYDSVPGFAKKSFCALGAGGIAAVMGNPADLALIRMQTDSMLPVAERRNYSGVGHALSTIASQEGPTALFKGALPTATRAMALNFGMLAFNAQAKEMLQGAGCSAGIQVFGAFALAGFAASAFSLPFDFVKTQIQRMKPEPVTGEMRGLDSHTMVTKRGLEQGLEPHSMVTKRGLDSHTLVAKQSVEPHSLVTKRGFEPPSW